ncbi:MAG: DUF6575 domain-containing protein [Bacilli bacterium]
MNTRENVFCPIPGFDVIEVYDYYDMPILFSCENVVGALFMAMCAEEMADGYRWLLLPVSKERLGEIKCGRILLKRAFKMSETGWVYQVNDDDQSETPAITIVQVADISDEDLPGEMAALNFSSGDLPPKAENIQLTAKRVARDIVDIDLITNDVIHDQEVPAEVLGETLIRIQKLQYSLASPDISGGSRVSKTTMEDNKFHVVAFHAASFGVRLASSRSVDLFNETPTQKALSILMNLISTGHDRDTLSRLLGTVGKRSVARFRFLLKGLLDGRVAMGIEWAAPDGGRQRTTLNMDQANSILEILEEMSDEIVEEIDLTGMLLAVDTIRHTFKFKSVEGTLYTGRTSDQLNPSEFRLQKECRANISETLILHPVTHEEQSIYELLDLRDLD